MARRRREVARRDDVAARIGAARLLQDRGDEAGFSSFAQAGRALYFARRRGRICSAVTALGRDRDLDQRRRHA